MKSNANIDNIEVMEPVTYLDAKKKEQRIQSLENQNKILITHLDYLRSQIQERDRHIELFSEVLVEMDDQQKIILN